MADGTLIAQPAADPIVAVDIDEMRLRPLTSILFYRLTYTRASGASFSSEQTISAAEFNAALGSFCQATPKKKFLQWLITSGHESNITPT